MGFLEQSVALPAGVTGRRVRSLNFQPIFTKMFGVVLL